MSTKRSLIEQAAGEFGIGTGFDLSPDELQDGLARLNRLAALWDGQGIRVGYNFGSDVEAESGIPDTAEHAFATNLAVSWAPSFGKQISLDTRVAARTSWSALYVARGVTPVQARNPALPIGTGNRTRGVLGRPFFPEPGDEVQGLNDGATEY